MSYSYQWQRCNSSGASCAPVFGATSSTDLLGSADVGSTMRVSVTASNSAGSSTAASAATALVGQAPAPASLLLKADAEGSVSSEFGQTDTGPHCQSRPAQVDTDIHKSTFRVQGSYSWEFEHFPSDPDCYGRRSEAVLGDSLGIHKFNEGDNVWQAFQVYLPSAINGTDYSYWISTTQTSKPYCGGAPRGQLTQAQGKWMFMEGETPAYNADLGSTGAIFLTDLPVVSDRWVKFSIHTYYNVDMTKGFVELYGDLQDGRGFRLLMPKTYGATNGYCADGSVAHPMVRLGLYAHPSFPNIHFVEYIDGMTVSDSRDAAEQNAFGNIP
jgi:Polysaccharide lyase